MRKLTIITFFFFILGFFLLSFAFPQIPHLINYQAKLTDTQGNPVPDGTHQITFRLYDADSGGNLLWEETQSLLITIGIFSCLLGGVTELNLPFDKPYWLAIKVGSDSEMTPRQQLASVGYALRAERAERAENADLADTATNASDSDKVDGKDYNSTDIKPLGNLVSRAKDTEYQADTDGFVCASNAGLGGGDSVTGYVNDTVVAVEYTRGESPAPTLSITFPVKKGDYWRVTGTGNVTLFWIPLGS